MRNMPRRSHTTPASGGSSSAMSRVRIAYREAGSGPETVVLLHGIGVGSTYFASLARLLARGRRVLVPELPGTGRSGRPSQPLDVPGAAAALEGVLQRLVRGRAPTLVANSLGCQVTIELARNKPARVGPLVLIGPTVDPLYRSFVRQGIRLGIDFFREPPALWPIVARDYLRMGPFALASTSRHALADRPEDKLPEVKSPVLVLRGEHDAITTRGWVRRCAALAPHGSFETIPGAAHAPHFSHPALVAVIVERFLAECGHSGRELGGRLDHRHVPGFGKDNEP